MPTYNNFSIPLFKSNYSVGRSILTVDAEQTDAREPDSIPLIAKELGLDHFYLVDDSISGLIDCYKSCKKLGLDFTFGLRLTFVPNLEIKDDDSLRKEAKYIIFLRNMPSYEVGYREIIKIWSKAAKDGFYYQPRLDFKSLAELWTDNLSLAVPYYDSFIHNNALNFGQCSNDFELLKTKPVFFIEDNNLPFEPFLTKKVLDYCKSSGYDTLQAQSIFYKERKDFKTYLTRRCIDERTSIEKPNLENMTSDTFCVEEWVNKNT